MKRQDGIEISQTWAAGDVAAELADRTDKLDLVVWDLFWDRLVVGPVKTARLVDGHLQRCQRTIHSKEELKFLFLGGVAEVRLKTGEIAVVDDEDLQKVAHIKWYRHKQGYATGYIPSSFRGAKDWHLVLMHQLILPGCPKVDNWDGDRLNNRRKNLRRANNFQHARNVKVRTTPTKTSKFKGVCWQQQKYGAGKWMVRVAREFIGRFEDEVEAAEAYNRAALERFGEFAKLNIIR